ncbi:MAG: iron-siderophore ABC transporter substrate-binding protein [Actinomycetota bacterium]
MPMPSRSTLRRLGGAALVVCLVAACSDDEGDDGAAPATEALDTTPPTDAPENEAADEAESEAFPVTVSTAFGDVVVDAAPERVVALGWGDAETALALGVQPVGAADWLGFGGAGVGPWAEGMYDVAPEILDVTEVNFEAIAALEPDLILNVRAAGDAESHEVLTAIAPTIGIPVGGEAFLTTQEQQVTLISQALGLPDDGQQLLDEVETEFTAARDAHPEWDGQTVSVATRFGDVWGGYVEGEGRLDFFRNLGFVQNSAIAALEPDGGFYATVSPENLDVFDADLIVAFPIGFEVADIENDPVWQNVPAVGEGRSIVVGGDLSNAYSLNSTMSALYALEQMVPLVEGAVGS